MTSAGSTARTSAWLVAENPFHWKAITAKSTRTRWINTVFQRLRFNYKWSDAEVKQAKHMQDTFEEIIHAMGGIALGKKPGPETNYGLEAPGKIIHEIGTARMGKRPEKLGAEQVFTGARRQEPVRSRRSGFPVARR
jgi:hypothetical protein